MASIHLGQTADCLGNKHVKKLISLDSTDSQVVEVSSKNPTDNYDVDDEFGEPEIQPRVGDEYQAELPSLNEEFGIVLLTRSGHVTDAVAHFSESFVIGLPIPLPWASDVKHDVLGSCGSAIINSYFMHIDSNNAITAETSLGEIETNLETTCKLGSISGCLVIAGLVNEQWTAIEKDSFLLGLYIFEKNFIEVRQFVGTKQMGSLLSFYYGKFYSSQEHRRWSQCRKMKSKKCIYGQRIFTGLRQQELLSRILLKVSEECRSALLEVSQTFADEKMSLSDYVLSLKARVGMALLVEAVGIGTGKHDLTGMALEPPKTNPVIPVRLEIPTGKACSSLTTEDIVKFLSGNYRLSKARSNDLFWEAVWPRLLACGWHSEQPRSKQCLVFLIPGIKKFSRSKLVKGNHYFDSVTDILSKVAQEPGLIELDMEEDGNNKKARKHESTDEKRLEKDGDDSNLPTRQRHCYLQSKTTNRNGAVFKFTVVDTSLSDGKVRDLRTLPSEISNVFIARALAEDSDEDTSEDTNDDTIMVGTYVTGSRSLKKVKFDGKQLPVQREYDARNPRAFLDTNAILAPDSKNKKVSKGPKQSRKVSKSNVNQNKKKGCAGHEADLIVKQHQFLSASGQKGSVGLGNGIPSFCMRAHEVTQSLSSHVSSCLDKLSSTTSSSGSPSGSNEYPHTMIDLNLPCISSRSEPGVFITESSKEQDSVRPENCHSQKPSVVQVRSKQPKSNPNPLRRSTRNRPPTSRALEALADGYLTVNRKRKGKDSQDAASRPQRARVPQLHPNEPINSSEVSRIEEADTGVSNSTYTSMFIISQGLAQANEESVSGQCEQPSKL